MFIVLFGPPGCGKGTQAATLSRHFNLPSLSTGDMLRTVATEGTPRGNAIKYLIDEGYLVPDELVNHMVFNHIESAPACKNGAIFDGYPRTAEQAKALDAFLTTIGKKVDYIIDFDVNMDELVERRAGRLYAPTSKRVYHETFNPPQVPGIDDETGEPLIHRKDDQPDVVRHRLEQYEALCKPVLDYYRQTRKVNEVNGMAAIGSVTQQLLDIIKPTA
ncbi:MAG TPA: adenylate kinase [Alphaproteobacteria bacterium]|nr:adenylate kinase [Alphaproteobacteria bacterium]